MITNQITLTNNRIGTYIEKNEGKIKVSKRQLERENKQLKKRIRELEGEIQALRQTI